MSENLKRIYTQLLLKYTDESAKIDKAWADLEKLYTQRNRHYHNLIHLENMLAELEDAPLIDRDSVVFSVFYHDIIYKSTSKDNEERSAGKAVEVLSKFGIDQAQLRKISDMIIATKNHEKSSDSDTNFLLDADLSILGKPWEKYSAYLKQIRKEYSIYPDFMYKPGRIKVLGHFLNFSQIYHTDLFFFRYEQQAKENILREIDLLKN